MITDCFGREILARRKAAGRKGPQSYLNNTVRTFLTENAAAGQGRPKPNACEIFGLRTIADNSGWDNPESPVHSGAAIPIRPGRISPRGDGSNTNRITLIGT
jgi:hypothetical protein